MKILTPNQNLNSIKLKENEDLSRVARLGVDSTGKKQDKNIAFTGAVDTLTQGLMFLDMNKAWGASFVDFAFMVSPRTAVDFTRGPEAGVETMRREASGTTNHALVGAYGLAAGSLAALAMNNKYGINAQKLFTSDETLDILGKNWHDVIHNNSKTPEKEFFEKTLRQVYGFNNDKKWVGLSDKTIKTLAAKMEQEVLKNDITKKDITSLPKEVKNYLMNLAGSDVGAESQFKLKNAAGKESVIDLTTLIDNTYKSAQTFRKEKVAKIFREIKDFGANEFIKSVKRLNLRTSLLGLGVGAAIGCSIQPLNMYLTKKKTGKSGFVGGGEPDKSAGFWGLKGLTALAFGAMVYKTIGGKPAEMLQKLQFKGFTPRVDQFKAVYGLTIMSRFLAARNKDELREAATKDTLGFLNWIVLGSFVQNIVASAFEKYSKHGTFLKYDESKGALSTFKKITGGTLITRNEVLYDEMKKLGQNVVEGDKALSFKTLMKKLPANSPAKKKIMLLNVAQLAGYAYSGLVLGIGIPKLNIAVTEGIKKRREQKKALENTKVGEKLASA